MSEAFWKHRFVAELLKLIQMQTGLGPNRSFDMAYGETAKFWENFGRYESPEAAAAVALSHLKSE